MQEGYGIRNSRLVSTIFLENHESLSYNQGKVVKDGANEIRMELDPQKEMVVKEVRLWELKFPWMNGLSILNHC